MRILVTGGAGLIGSHLCRFLLEKENEVICLDNLHTSSGDNIRPLLDDDRFTFIEHDIVDHFHLDVEQIYNLACPASPVHYQKDPVRTIRTSVQGSIHLLELARNNNARILQASTSEIYGHPRVHPQPESYWGNVNPNGIRSCYDEGKRCAETLFYDYHRQYGVDVRVARIFNTYGQGMQPDDGRVISNFTLQALHDHDITIFGDGTQSRSFCHVSDMIRGLVMLMNGSYIHPVNLGNPAEITMKALAERILRMTNSRSRLIYTALPEDDPVRRQPDIQLASTLLGWKPEVSLETGLQETIRYFKDRIADGNLA